MVIFHCYVSSPEGMLNLRTFSTGSVLTQAQTAHFPNCSRARCLSHWFEIVWSKTSRWLAIWGLSEDVMYPNSTDQSSKYPLNRHNLEVSVSSFSDTSYLAKMIPRENQAQPWAGCLFFTNSLAGCDKKGSATLEKNDYKCTDSRGNRTRDKFRKTICQCPNSTVAANHVLNTVENSIYYYILYPNGNATW